MIINNELQLNSNHDFNPHDDTEEFTLDDEDWDIGLKGGETEKDDDMDWKSPEFIRQFMDNGFDDSPPEGYTPNNEDPN